mmetsp:Transcript_9533/g.17974  ORF Transcript_9533/g.17974 Transcript_9533/m.17974 type:complete len:644 (+) Transcript_9533:148-2079(+)
MRREVLLCTLGSQKDVVLMTRDIAGYIKGAKICKGEFGKDAEWQRGTHLVVEGGPAALGAQPAVVFALLKQMNVVRAEWLNACVETHTWREASGFQVFDPDTASRVKQSRFLLTGKTVEISGLDSLSTRQAKEFVFACGGSLYRKKKQGDQGPDLVVSGKQVPPLGSISLQELVGCVFRGTLGLGGDFKKVEATKTVDSVGKRSISSARKARSSGSAAIERSSEASTPTVNKVRPSSSSKGKKTESRPTRKGSGGVDRINAVTGSSTRTRKAQTISTPSEKIDNDRNKSAGEKRDPTSGVKGRSVKRKITEKTKSVLADDDKCSRRKELSHNEDVSTVSPLATSERPGRKRRSTPSVGEALTRKSKKVEEKKMTPKEKEDMCIALSGFNKIDLNMISTIVKSIHGDTSCICKDEFASEATHVIVQNKEDLDNKKSLRTVKVVNGIARGAWIVHVSWLYQCLEKGEWVKSEKEHEAFKLLPGCRLSRLCKERGELKSTMLSNVKLHLLGKTNPSQRILKHLIRQANGDLSTLDTADVIIAGGSKFSQYKSGSSNVRPESWIFDGFEHGDFKLASKQNLSRVKRRPLSAANTNKTTGKAVSKAKFKTPPRSKGSKVVKSIPSLLFDTSSETGSDSDEQQSGSPTV